MQLSDPQGRVARLCSREECEALGVGPGFDAFAITGPGGMLISLVPVVITDAAVLFMPPTLSDALAVKVTADFAEALANEFHAEGKAIRLCASPHPVVQALVERSGMELSDLTVMPTPAGKMVCYQVAPRLEPLHMARRLQAIEARYKASIKAADWDIEETGAAISEIDELRDDLRVLEKHLHR